MLTYCTLVNNHMNAYVSMIINQAMCEWYRSTIAGSSKNNSKNKKRKN